MPGPASVPGTGRRAARPSGALAAQRRWAGAVALAVVAVALVTIAIGTRQLDGGVLSATGTPALTIGGGAAGSDGVIATPAVSGGPSEASPTRR